MRNTGSKEVRVAVRNYLEAETEMSMHEIKMQFIHVYAHMISRIGEMPACLEWLRGLGIPIDYDYYNIARILADWLDDSVESQEMWIEKRGDDLYWLLIAREIVNTRMIPIG